MTQQELVELVPRHPLLTLGVVAGTVAFLIRCYPTLPDLLPVRFNWRSRPIGWQYKTAARVLMPAFVEAALALILGSVGAVILSRSHAAGDEEVPDIVAASATAEAIALVGFVWVACLIQPRVLAAWKRYTTRPRPAPATATS